uniref:Uncharacterized protein n=1 Tax=Branchiostoma floridae TaxID=7739 RepID=C3YY20_BRAFL|eukprot:XP_002598967.1 hypothetical protein BRAFLDRAFT_79901 [Branchiostoma floridae]
MSSASYGLEGHVITTVTVIRKQRLSRKQRRKERRCYIVTNLKKEEEVAIRMDSLDPEPELDEFEDGCSVTEEHISGSRTAYAAHNSRAYKRVHLNCHLQMSCFLEDGKIPYFIIGDDAFPLRCSQ